MRAETKPNPAPNFIHDNDMQGRRKYRKMLNRASRKEVSAHTARWMHRHGIQ